MEKRKIFVVLTLVFAIMSLVLMAIAVMANLGQTPVFVASLVSLGALYAARVAVSRYLDELETVGPREKFRLLAIKVAMVVAPAAACLLEAYQLRETCTEQTFLVRWEYNPEIKEWGYGISAIIFIEMVVGVIVVALAIRGIDREINYARRQSKSTLQ